MFQRFDDRHQAGQALAQKLIDFKDRKDVIVIALPRGGVPVAYEVARALNLPIDILVVRKLGAPGHEEFAIGALAAGGIQTIDDELVRALNISDMDLARIVDREQEELDRRERLYRGSRPPINLRDKTAIIVDDGLATGSTMRAAVKTVLKMKVKEVVVAVPVCAPLACGELRRDVDAWCVCVYAPGPFYSVGVWYKNFDQTSDEEVERLLAKADAGGVYARHYV